jgi:hypothetical protein
MNDRAFIRGAESLLFDYAWLGAGQSAVFVYDPEVEALCDAIGAIALGAGITVRNISAALDWTAVLVHIRERCDAVMFLESGVSHHTWALLDYLSTGDHAPRAYRLFGTTAETIRNGFRRPQARLRLRNWALIEHARRAGHLTVASDCGTRLEVDILVADGAIASNIGWPLDARLGAHPVTLRISRGRVTDVECRHAFVRDLVEEFFSVPNNDEVVEIGIGTNDGIPKFLPPDILLNERVASFHLGVGTADAEKKEQNLHLDFILGDCRIVMGGHIVLSNGQFVESTSEVIPDRRLYDVPVSLHDAL